MKRLHMEFLSAALSWLFTGILLTGLMLLCRCSGDAASDYTGTYVSHGQSEFSIAHDTIVVEREAGNDLVFLLHRRTGFRLLDEQGERGNPGVWQFEKEEWTAVADRETGFLTEQRYGKQIRFDEQRKEMTVGKRRYMRIK